MKKYLIRLCALAMAILILAVPFLGIGSRPAELALVVLAIPPLLTNTYVGMIGVDDDVRGAARGVGMTDPRLVHNGATSGIEIGS